MVSLPRERRAALWLLLLKSCLLVPARAFQTAFDTGPVRGAPPLPPFSEPGEQTPVHVVIAAFQDTARCARTLGWALEKASHPERLRFSVMQARTAEEPGCVAHFVSEYIEKRQQFNRSVLGVMREWSVSLDEAMGPAHTRGLLSERLTYGPPDEMCLSMDSHMNFMHGWDDLLLKDWASTRNEFAVLTAYVADMGTGEDQKDSYIDNCGWLEEEGIPRGQQGGTLPKQPDLKPYLTMNWAAGFSFHRCHAERSVPVDPNLKFIFTGEEINRAVRLWTHGYDMYNPTGLFVTHDYTHPNQNFWSHGKPTQQSHDTRSSRKRLSTLLMLDKSAVEVAVAGSESELSEEQDSSKTLGQYGLGTQRTLAQYVEWTRFDMGGPWTGFLAHRGGPVERPSMSCKGLERVPLRDAAALRSTIGLLASA